MKTQNLTKLFSYEGNEVTFRSENGVAYINANEMARPFVGKEPKQWFDNQDTHDFIHALAEYRGIKQVGRIRTSLNTSELAKLYPSLLMVVKGGTPGKVKQGTWLHEDVAIEYARWLSPAFSIWCNERIRELLTVGMTTTLSVEDIANNPDLLIEMATKLKESREKEELARKEAEQANYALEQTSKELKKTAPKAKYYDEVLQSSSAINTNQIALELGITAIKLNNFLSERKIIYRQGDQWLLYGKYRNMGLHKMDTFKFLNRNDEIETKTHLKWTEKGRKEIHKLYNAYLNKDN